eukprot:SAG22_NODE_1175_length_5248_cov_5.674694_5_plen_127_part_00
MAGGARCCRRHESAAGALVAPAMRPAAGTQLRLLLLASATAGLFAQCVMPALPADTVIGDCPAAGADLLDAQTCTISCAAGNAQGAEGTYVYTCDGTELTEPAPVCAACILGEYNEAAGAAACTPW